MEKIGKISFCRSDFLGRGRFGSVFKGKLNNTLDIAVKRVEKRIAHIEANAFFRADGHSNIIRHYCTKDKDIEFIYICTELCSTTLDGYIRGEYIGPPIGNKYQILSQIGLGLEHLHSLDIVHGSLQPSNVLISVPTGTIGPAIKLTDFGLRFLGKARNNSFDSSTSAEDQSAELRAACIATEGWVTPDTKLTPASDIFPFGCLIGFVLIDGFHPFGADVIERVPRIVKKQPMVLTLQQLENVVGFAAAHIHSLIQSMVNPEASERPTVTQVLASPFLNGQMTNTEPVRTTSSSNQTAEPDLTQVKQENASDDEVLIIDTVIKTEKRTEFGTSSQPEAKSKRGKSVSTPGKKRGRPAMKKVKVEVQDYEIMHLKTVKKIIPDIPAEESSNKPTNRIHMGSAEPVPSTSTSGTSSSTSNQQFQPMKKNKKPSTIAENSVQQANDSQPTTASHGRGKSYRSGSSQSNPSARSELSNDFIFIKSEENEMPAEVSSNKPINRIHTRSAGPVPSTSTAWTSSKTSKKNKHPSTKAENSVQKANVSQPITTSYSREKSYRSSSPQSNPPKTNEANGDMTESAQSSSGAHKPSIFDINTDKSLAEKQQLLVQLCRRQDLNETDLDRLRELALDPEVDINQGDELNETPLLLLCRANQCDSLYSALRILLKNEHIDLTAITRQSKQTALTLLCRYYRQNNLIDCVKLLLKRKVPVDVETRDGRNAFMLLCENFGCENLVEIATLLLRKMVDLRTANLSLSILRERGFENESDALVFHLRSRRSALERQKE